MKYIFLLILLALCNNSFAQITISGRVVSANDSIALSGATIKVLGSDKTAITDINGQFSLNAEGDSVHLQVSFVGFQPVNQKISLPLKKPLLIRLIPQLQQVKEIIVSTGYQVLPKERVTGSFTQIDNNLLNQQVSTNTLGRLETISNGLTVDHSTTKAGRILIRGLSTINGPSQPLIVLDNFPYEGDPNNINPNDVESITILKDAAAASIWGTRAGNGVIVITTKKGRFNQPLLIELNSNVTISQKPDLFYSKPISTSDYIDVEKNLFSRGYYDDLLNYAPYVAQTPVIELLNAARNGTISGTEANSEIDAFRRSDVRNEFKKYLYKPSVIQQYALNIRAGNEYSAWSVSGGYDKNLSSLGVDYDRVNLRFQNSLKLNKWVTLTDGLYYTQSNNHSGRPGYGDIYQQNGSLYPYAKFADAKGNPLPIAKDFSSTWTALPENGGILDWNYYPLEDYKHSRNLSTTQDFNANLGMSFQLFKGLSLDVKYQYERQQTNGRNSNDIDSYFTRNLINLFTQADPSTRSLSYPLPKGDILDLSHNLLKNQNGRWQLNYINSWKKNEVSFIAGWELRQVTTERDVNRLYGYNGDNLTFGNVDYLTEYPLYGLGYPFNIPDGKDLTSLKNRYQSLFANGAYTYDSRFTISASIRRDASNLFGVKTNDKWTPLYSTGLSWNILRESFINIDWLNTLKFRTTYGLSGNVDPTHAAVTTISYTDTSPYTQLPYADFSNYANPQLKWETAAITNVGMDFSVRNERLSGSIEYFHKSGKDLFGQVQIDYTSGIGATVVKNEAAMIGNGIDVALHSVNTTGNVKWTTDFNYSYFKDKITKYYLPSPQSVTVAAVGVSSVVGRPVYSLFAFKSAGLDPENGDPRGYLNGQITKDYSALLASEYSNLVFKGSLLPTNFGSLGNTITWKNWSLTARIAYKFGYYFRRRSIDYGTLYSIGEGNADYTLRWEKPGDENSTTVPSAIYPNDPNRDTFYRNSTDLVEKADHIRLQYVTATWTLNKSAFPQLPFKSMQVYINANNLGILWRANKHGIDPDYYGTVYTLPPAKTLSLGLRINF